MIIYKKPNYNQLSRKYDWSSNGGYESYFTGSENKGCRHGTNQTFSFCGDYYYIGMGCQDGNKYINRHLFKFDCNGNYGSGPAGTITCPHEIMYNPSGGDYCVQINYLGKPTGIDGYSDNTLCYYLYILGNISCKWIGKGCRYCCYGCGTFREYDCCNYPLYVENDSGTKNIYVGGTKIANDGKYCFCVKYCGTSNGQFYLSGKVCPLSACTICGNAKFYKCI